MREATRQRVSSLRLPARDEVVTLGQFRYETRHLLRIVLQVTVHSEDGFAARGPKTRHQRRRLPEVGAELNRAHYARLL